MMHLRVLLLSGVVALFLALTACGGEDGSTPADTPGDATAEATVDGHESPDDGSSTDTDPPPVLTALDLATMEPVLVRLSACTGSPLSLETVSTFYASPFGGKVGPDVISAIQCATDAQDCPGALACLGILADEPCTQGTFGHCQGTSVVTCEAHPNGMTVLSALDCADDLTYPAEEGGKCLIGTSGKPGCGHGSCTGTGSLCDGEVATFCVDGLEQRVDCERFGSVCVTSGSDDDATAFCALGHEACDTDTCDGDQLVLCTDTATTGRLDCTSFGEGYGCRTVEGVGSCGLASSTCDEGTTRCQGAAAEICFGGGWLSFDCGSFLEGTCEDSDDVVGCVVTSWP